MGSESRTVVPPNRTNRPSPGSSIGFSHSPGAFGCLRQNRSCRPGLLRSEKNGLLAFPWGFSSSLPPSEIAVSYLSAVWCRRGVFAVPVRMMWLLVFAKICCGCLPSGDCNFSCARTMGQLRLFGCLVFDVAPVLSGCRAVCQGGELHPSLPTSDQKFEASVGDLFPHFQKIYYC